MSRKVAEVATTKDVEKYQNRGVVLLRGAFNDWILTLRKGADFNVKHPSHRALVHGEGSNQGRFLEDFCSWQRIPEYEDFIYHSSMGAIAARLMQSRSAQFFHDHYLDKEAATGVATPWHQDSPYYFIQGEQTVSFWIPLEAREKEVSLRCVAGSHKLPKEIRPTSWSTMDSFYGDDSNFMDLPDIEGGNYHIKAWAMEPGDAVAFNFRMIHGAHANMGKTVSRTLSFRLLGDDVRFLQRPGRTSPDFPDIKQKSGERLREDWFPVIWRA
jgi:ectoine hydroxylase-related dioxygenase (phytanoyl-CoA dioxygenase family)